MKPFPGPVPWVLTLCLSLLPACGSGSADQEIIRRTQFLMGTLVEITVREPEKAKAQRAITAAFDEIARIEKLMSSRDPASEVSRINAAAGKAFVPVSPETGEVVREGIRWGELSGGALDITIGPVVSLWKFDAENPALPDPTALERATQRVNYRDIQVEKGKIRLARPGMALDLGALAKGFAVDRAATILKDLGIAHAIVNAGGDLRVFGSRGPNRPWKIGLQHPRKPGELAASFETGDEAVATSGDYQRYFILNGTRYHHLLNPSDGLPARGLTSVTVRDSSAMSADALSTAAFVLGEEKGMRLINSIADMEGLMIGKNGEQKVTAGFYREGAR